MSSDKPGRGTPGDRNQPADDESYYRGPASGPAYPSAHPMFVDDTPREQRRDRDASSTPTASSEPREPHDSDAAHSPRTGSLPTHGAGSSEAAHLTDAVGNDFLPTADFAVEDGVRDVGMCFLGASMTSGFGDPKALGWVGRVVARTQHPDLLLTAYNLGVRGQTSGDLLGRWRAECTPRWKGRSERRLVLSVGANDIATGMTMARSRLNLANIIDEATNGGIGVFCVGLAPTLDPELNQRIEALAEAQADVCARRGVTYVDCFRPLVGHDQWSADLAASPDRTHPGQAGYGLIAWLVLHNGWNHWLRIG